MNKFGSLELRFNNARNGPKKIVHRTFRIFISCLIYQVFFTVPPLLKNISVEVPICKRQSNIFRENYLFNDTQSQIGNLSKPDESDNVP